MEKKKYIPRTLSAKVAEMTRSFPCVMVTGARQVGKSTMVATCRCIEYCAGDAAAGKRECEFPDFRGVNRNKKNSVSDKFSYRQKAKKKVR